MTSGNGRPTDPKTAKILAAANKKAAKSTSAVTGGIKKRQIPWITIGALAVVVALIGAITWVLMPKYLDKKELAQYVPSKSNPDPSKKIDGVQIRTDKVDQNWRKHLAAPNQRVNYDSSPPVSGAHDPQWADCMGMVYDQGIRTENMVHSLEHGAAWITYNPAKVDAAGVATLKTLVQGKPYTAMSPVPTLDQPIAVISWGHSLKVSSADDKRLPHFIAALRQNPNTTPEAGASCSAPLFDAASSPFIPTPPDPADPNTIGMDGAGLPAAPTPMAGGAAPGAPVPAEPVPAAPLPAPAP